MSKRLECECSCGCTDGFYISDGATPPPKPKCSRCIMGVHLGDR
jgi:hypothetical protein